MTRPMSLNDFVRLPPAVRGSLHEGLAAAIDGIAARGAESHRFLRYQWYAAALQAYGGHARTLIVEQDETPVLAMPLVARRFGMVEIPGSYWPFRSFAVGVEADEAVFETALDVLARQVRGLRIGPVADGDVAVAPLIAAARARGWLAIDRSVMESWVLDLTEDAWPRGSTLRKNRFHEKHLADHGALDWRIATGGDWPAAFADLAAVERASWIGADTDGRDAKFTAAGHGAFWRAAATDPVLAAMFHAAILDVANRPAAFSFDIDVGMLKYAIANSYDPAFARHSPGKLLYYRNLVAARARGVTTVDWGTGDSGYKRVLGAQEGPAIRDWLLLRPGLPALAGRLLAALWRRSGTSHADALERDSGEVLRPADTADATGRADRG